MDELSLTEIVYTVYARMRAHKVPFSEAFAHATSRYSLDDNARSSLSLEVKQRIEATGKTTLIIEEGRCPSASSSS